MGDQYKSFYNRSVSQKICKSQSQNSGSPAPSPQKIKPTLLFITTRTFTLYILLHIYFHPGLILLWQPRVGTARIRSTGIYYFVSIRIMYVPEVVPALLCVYKGLIRVCFSVIIKQPTSKDVSSLLYDGESQP